ncbi:MafI family immunity protein [Kineococcus sp. NBC_00420]|uniref:MafI family immunity protein n=1 Tax=Kineococcus sp. NBC_00420 TaxID=2903564 RepID=UPI002E208B1C
MEPDYFMWVAAELRELASRLRGRLSDSAERLVEEYVSVNELGLALESLVDALAEAEQPVSADERATMLALANPMGLQDEVTRALAFCPLP